MNSHNIAFDETTAADEQPSEAANPDFDDREDVNDHWLQYILFNSKQMQECAETDETTGKPLYPKYDPYFFDNYCSAYVLCKKTYNAECKPVDALGFDAQQTRMLESLVIGIPTYVFYIMLGLILTPFGMCMYMEEYNAYQCSLGLISYTGTGSWTNAWRIFKLANIF